MNEDRHVRITAGDDAGGLHAVDRRHPEVHDDHVGAEARDSLDGFQPVARRADDLDAGDVPEAFRDGETDRRDVVHDEDPDHRLAHESSSLAVSTVSGRACRSDERRGGHRQPRKRIGRGHPDGLFRPHRRKTSNDVGTHQFTVGTSRR